VSNATSSRTTCTCGEPAVYESGWCGVQHIPQNGFIGGRFQPGWRRNLEMRALRFTPHARIKLLSPTAKAPQYMTAGAAGADVFADLGGEHEVDYFAPERVHRIPLGFAIEIPPGWVGILKGRSGLAAKGHEGHVAAIDSDYRGQVCMLLHVNGAATKGEPLAISHGDRVGQLLIMPAPQFKLEVVDELSDTARGTGGFGSTGSR
jgi:dUTP pyrophosphatase